RRAPPMRVREIMMRLGSIYIDVPALRPGTVGAYALAFVSAAVATALRLFLDPYFEGAPFVTYFPAIIITTATSGFGGGLVCVVLSTAAVYFFVLRPRFSFLIENPVEAADLVLFTPLASLCVMLITWMRSAIERAGGPGVAGEQRSSAACPRHCSNRVVAVRS